MTAKNIGSYCRSNYSLYPYARKYGEDRIRLQANLSSIGRKALSILCNQIIYNNTNLRILYDMASDGTAMDNYKTNSDGTDDKKIVNVKSDIIEQYWETYTKENILISFDVGSMKTSAIDTLGIIGTNLSKTASIVLKGFGGESDASPSWANWSSAADIATFYGNGSEKIVWIPEKNPSNKFRHYCLVINDKDNEDDYIRIGRIIAGRSLCLSGENCISDISMKKTNYKDEFIINGFTTIANNRTIKKSMTIGFKNLNRIGYLNYKRIMDMIDVIRDTMKCLVIVDPSDQYKYNYTLFAKLKECPDETHSYISDDTSNVSIVLTFDEAR